MGSLILKYQVQYEQSGLLRAHEAFFLPAATWPEPLEVLITETEEAQVQMFNTSTSVSHSGHGCDGCLRQNKPMCDAASVRMQVLVSCSRRLRLTQHGERPIVETVLIAWHAVRSPASPPSLNRELGLVTPPVPAAGGNAASWCTRARTSSHRRRQDVNEVIAPV